ncbi:hypothetical protein RFI_35081, partial [Reticulomyxa filosa]
DNVNIASKDFEEMIEKQKSIQQEIYEKYLEKIKLKSQVDEAISNYTKCIEQYNNLCSIEKDILIEKQQKEQELITINQIYAFDKKVLKGFNEFNDKLQKLTEKNQNWIEKENGVNGIHKKLQFSLNILWNVKNQKSINFMKLLKKIKLMEYYYQNYQKLI